MQNMSSTDGFDASWQALKGVVTDPEFQKVLQEIGNLPPSEHLQAVFTRLTPPALEARGIRIPRGFSITTSVSWRSVDPITPIANAAATGQSTAGSYVPEVESRACIHLPFGICIPIPVPPPPPPIPPLPPGP